MDDKKTRRNRALNALEGLALGDAFGQQFFGTEDEVVERINRRQLPEGVWHLTDDSIMAGAIYQVLCERDETDPDRLASMLAEEYRREPMRGYGGTAHNILRRLGDGENWREVAPSVLDGMGSYGNGAAMRVAPLGAWFADEIQVLKEQAQLSAMVTHSHIEAVARAIAVA